MMPCSVSVSSFRCPITREMRKPISKNATGSMMTYLPNSIIIRSCLIKKKTWIWWGHLTDLRSGGMDIRENPNGEKYYFERIKGAWILEAINLRPVERK